MENSKLFIILYIAVQSETAPILNIRPPHVNQIRIVLNIIFKTIRI